MIKQESLIAKKSINDKNESNSSNEMKDRSEYFAKSAGERTSESRSGIARM
jgi:hypothetical protein